MDRKQASTLAQRVFIFALMMLLVATIVLMWLPNSDSVVVKDVFAAALTLLLVSLIPMIALRVTTDQEEKAKRGLEGLDMYTVIDRLVADLDDDEAAYLQRRLDERDAKAKDKLTASLGDLLDQRAESRRSNEDH